MNAGYQNEDQNIIDYELWKIPGMGLSFRGPAFDIKPSGYFTAIGAAQTFGRFVPVPYPREIAQEIGLPCLNLGYSGAGPTFFTDRPPLIDLINQSRFAIVQVMSGRSVSNSCFTVQANQGLSAPIWKGAHEPAAFAEQAYEEYLTHHSVEEVMRLRAEIRVNYIEKMQQLMAAIRVPKVLLYWSTRKPNYGDGVAHIGEYWGGLPHFVNQAVVDELKPLADAYVQVITSEGLPQPLRHKETGEPYEMWPRDSFPGDFRRDMNYYYPSPEMHRHAAAALLPFALKAASEAMPDRPPALPRRGKRNVLVHFHVFMNAAARVERLLADSFGDGFQAFGPGNARACLDEQAVIDHLRTRPHLSAVSCHHLRPPLSGDGSVQLHPIVFLRDPIDRVRSIYAYETTPDRRETSSLIHTVKANELGFRGFVEWCLGQPPLGAPVCNYQTRVYSMLHNGSDHGDWAVWTDERNLCEALGFLSTLPCVGAVDQFEKSADSIVENYRHFFPALRRVSFQNNTMREDASLSMEQKHAIVRDELGDELFRALVRRNALDLELYRYVTKRLNAM